MKDPTAFLAAVQQAREALIHGLRSHENLWHHVVGTVLPPDADLARSVMREALEALTKQMEGA